MGVGFNVLLEQLPFGGGTALMGARGDRKRKGLRPFLHNPKLPPECTREGDGDGGVGSNPRLVDGVSPLHYPCGKVGDQEIINIRVLTSAVVRETHRSVNPSLDQATIPRVNDVFRGAVEVTTNHERNLSPKQKLRNPKEDLPIEALEADTILEIHRHKNETPFVQGMNMDRRGSTREEVRIGVGGRGITNPDPSENSRSRRQTPLTRPQTGGNMGVPSIIQTQFL